MSQLSPALLAKGVVCASAGNHAQGFAYSCKKLGVKGVVFMPIPSPQQKVSQTKMFGDAFVEVKLVGDTFDDTAKAAKEYTIANGMTFVPPFDHPSIIEGQATVGVEILEDIKDHTSEPIDYIFVPIGGGGLIAGCGIVFSALSPKTLIIGVEPAGAPAMFESIKQDKILTLNQIDSFVDGAAVKKVGEINFPIVKKTMSKVLLVDEGKVCHTLLQLYNDEGFVVEPAGTLSIAALDDIKEEILKYV